MNESEKKNELKSFYDWLIDKCKSKKTAESICRGVDIIKKEYNIELEYVKDECTELLDDFTYTSTYAKMGDLPKVDIEIKGNCIEELRFLKKALKLYVEYLDAFMPVMTVGKSKTNVCIFEGSFGEFKSYTGPKWRNIIQAITRTRRKSIGECECCGLVKPLDAAHKTGLGRNEIIKDILDNNYTTAIPDIYRVDLESFETEFKNAHQPLEDVFFFLCKDCHNDYDGKDIVKSKNVETRVLANRKRTQNVANNKKAVSQNKPRTSSNKNAPIKGVVTEDEKFKMAADYLRSSITFEELDKKYFNIDNRNGVKSWSILNKLGIRGSQKGLLKTYDIDTAISNSNGVLKDTLIKIKVRGL